MTAGDLDSSLLGRLVRPADYVRVLATPMRLRSPHFAVHHMDGRPLPLKRLLPRAMAPVDGSDAASASVAPVTASLSTDLSTGASVTGRGVVEDSLVSGAAEASFGAGDAVPVVDEAPAGVQRWLGLVVPKRHAKRAVTRTLVKRQIRNVVADCAPRLAPGLWVVRQRHPFDPKQYPSAASDALKDAARAELRALFERAVLGERDRVKPRDPSAKPMGGKKAQKTSATPKTRPAASTAALPARATAITGESAVAPPQKGPPCAS